MAYATVSLPLQPLPLPKPLMVAAAAKPLSKPDRQRTRGQFKQIPILTRIKARNLYLVQGLGHRDIAAECGMTEQASHKLASREGWTKQRKEQKLALLAKADTRMGEAQSEAIEAIHALSEQHAIRGLERVGQALESHGEFAARDFQSYTGGVKNLVSIMREIRAPEASAVNASAGLSVFVVRVGEAAQPKQERNVTANTVDVKAEIVNANAPSLNNTSTV